MKANANINRKPEDFVESLQRNPNCTLLYGKNNVYVQSDGSTARVPGYLSLHHNLAGQSVVKWTPNFLMKVDDKPKEGTPDSEFRENETDSWQSALSASIEEIKYIYCHQQLGGRGTIVLVGRNGLEWPPLHFYDGCHLLAFLSSLEKALLPNGRVDPPVSQYKKKWKNFCSIDNYDSDSQTSLQTTNRSQEGAGDKERDVSEGKGCPTDNESESNTESEQEDEATDFIFHIQYSSIASDIEDENEFPTRHCWHPNYTKEALTMRYKFTGNVSKLHEKSKDIARRRNLSCIFYQWLAYCRHMKSLRKHLMQLVNSNIDKKCLRDDSTLILSPKYWDNLLLNLSEENTLEIFRHIYAAGCEVSIREKVWPYLLELYPWDSSSEAISDQELKLKTLYENHLKEWNTLERKFNTGSSTLDQDTQLNTEEDIETKDNQAKLTQEKMLKFDVIQNDVTLMMENKPYITSEFSTKLRQLICTIIQCNPNIYYFEGMCNIASIMLTTLKQESIVYGCLVNKLEVMKEDFCDTLDIKFTNLRSLIQLLDPVLFDHMRRNGDYTHLYFTKRWFLMCFTKEFSADDMPLIFEIIWSSKHIATMNFSLFIALALLEHYRNAIIQQDMGFVEVTKLFNEKAMTHDVGVILSRARDLVDRVQQLWKRSPVMKET